MRWNLLSVCLLATVGACADARAPLGAGDPPEGGLAAAILLPPGFRIEEFARDVTMS
jgi:hypothetical protein